MLSSLYSTKEARRSIKQKSKNHGVKSSSMDIISHCHTKQNQMCFKQMCFMSECVFQKSQSSQSQTPEETAEEGTWWTLIWVWGWNTPRQHTMGKLLYEKWQMRLLSAWMIQRFWLKGCPKIVSAKGRSLCENCLSLPKRTGLVEAVSQVCKHPL